MRKILPLGKLWMKLKKLILKYKSVQLLSYIAVGGITGIISISTLYILTEFLHIWYLFSSIIAYVFGIITHYNLNKRITFQNKSKKIITQFSVYLSVAAVSIGLNTLLLFIFVEFFNIWYIFSQIIIVLIMFIFNFIIHRTITFGKIK